MACAEGLQGGLKFCHTVTSQINFMASAEDKTIVVWSEGMPQKNFAKLLKKYAFSCILEVSFCNVL